MFDLSTHIYHRNNQWFNEVIDRPRQNLIQGFWNFPIIGRFDEVQGITYLSYAEAFELSNEDPFLAKACAYEELLEHTAELIEKAGIVSVELIRQAKLIRAAIPEEV